MTPSEIKNYLKERRRAPIDDIAMHFDMDADAARGMLELWIRKGKVRKLDSAGCDTSCCGGCESHVNETYEWVS